MPTERTSKASWLFPVAVGVAYWAAAALSLWLTQGEDGIATLWPPSGILLAAVIGGPRFGWRRCTAFAAIGSLAANLGAGNGWGVSIGFTVANVVEPLVALVIWRSLGGRRALFLDWQHVAKFCTASALAALSSAAIALICVPSPHLLFAASWYFTDLLGMLIVAPALLMSGNGWRPHAAHAGELLALALLAGVSTAIFAQTAYPLLFVPLVALLAVTWRAGVRGAAVGVLIVAVVGSVGTALGRGPLALMHASVPTESFMLQLYLLTLFATSLPLAALLASRREAARSCAESERAHRLLAEASGDIIVRFCFDGTPIYISPACERILGYTPQALLGRGATRDICPDDVGAVLAAWRHVADHGSEQTATYRQRTSDGRTVWLEASYRRVASPAGDHHEIVACVRDITRRREAEGQAVAAADALRSANAMLAEAESVAHLGHWRVDLNTGNLFWSAEVAAIHDSPNYHPANTEAALAFYHAEDRDRVRATLATAAQKGSPFRYEARLVTATGRIRHVSCRGQAQAGEGGTAVLFGTIQDISEWIEIGMQLDAARRAAEAAAATATALADTDALTGIASRRKVLACLDQAMTAARRGARNVALIVVDVDHFKAVNDRHGHAAGDDVLRGVAGVLATGLRSGDTVGRIGGEEFVVVSAARSIGEAHELAERLRKRVADAHRGSGGQVPVTASFGVALFDGTQTAEQLLAAADRALYAAKGAGRNVVRLAA